jgi:hypothetical protein
VNGQQLGAIERSVEALEAAGRIRPEHAAVVELVRGLAAAVDKHPDRPTLWREYRVAIERLAQATAIGDEEGDGRAAFLELVRTPLGDASDSEPTDPGHAGGGRGRLAGDAVPPMAEAGRRRRAGAAT